MEVLIRLKPIYYDNLCIFVDLFGHYNDGIYRTTSGLTRENHGPSVFIPCAYSNCVSKAGI